MKGGNGGSLRPWTPLSMQALDCNQAIMQQGAAFSPCGCLQVLTNEKNGYQAVQVGYLETRETRSKKPLIGHCRK